MLGRCFIVCSIIAVASLCHADEMSPDVLVRSYTDTLAKQQKFALKFTNKRVTTSQIFIHPNVPREEKPVKDAQCSSGEVITDGRRVAVRMNEWGQAYRNTRAIVASNPVYVRDTFDGRQKWNYRRHPQSTREPRGKLVIWPNPSATAIWDAVSVLYPGHFLLGYINRYAMSMDEVLRDPSTKLAVRKDPENISGSDCYVLDVSSLYGRGTLWLDPEHGYNIAQAHFSIGTGDVVKRTNKPITWPYESHFYLKDVTFNFVDSVWFPVQGAIELSVDCEAYWEKTVHHPKNTEVQLNPDMDAMDAFSTADIPNGAICSYLGQFVPAGSSNPYVWQDGQVIIRSGRN